MKLIADASIEKLRGGFYTPPEIAEFMLRWGINGSTKSNILEPSCGDGNFLRALKTLELPYNTVTAIELDNEEYLKAISVGLERTNIINAEFHDYCNHTTDRYNLIIGNPPYIRYQFFDREQQQEAATMFDRADLTYSKLTNAWVSFVVGSSLLLEDEGGKIGFVLPAEILQVSYAKQLRTYLAHFYNKINIISFEKLVFPNIQQEVVLLLCEKDNSAHHNIEHIELKDASELPTLDLAVLKSPQKRIDFNSSKWTFYFLNQEEIDFLEEIESKVSIPRLKRFAKVEVGITTGSNEFFTVPKSIVDEYELNDYAKPMVGRSVQVNSVIFTEEDWQLNQANQSRANLLVFPNKANLDQSNGAVKYIEYGEALNVHKGYKTSIREDWFVVPSVKVSDALFIRRNNLYPRLIINKARAYTTDTMHRVFIKPDTNLRALTASYYNSLTLAFTEVCGRSHGGGVLELMPNEAESILLPYSPENEHLLDRIDSMIRNKESIHDVLKITDEVVLKKHYGLNNDQIAMANNIWKKLSSRRLGRK